jgi:hypothetical protein
VFRAKDGHAYHGEHVTPPQRSAFVGLQVYVAVETERVLPQEYAESAVTCITLCLTLKARLTKWEARSLSPQHHLPVSTAAAVTR